MDKTKIFLCEDDKNLGLLLSQYLKAKGYECALFPDGEAGYNAFSNDKYDICILDVMMPKKDGFTLAQDIRRLNSNIPIVFLTAKSLQSDVLEGFKIGGDDYITKPFNMEELLLRIEAINRRSARYRESAETLFNIGNYTFNNLDRTLTLGSEVTKLTTKEAELLTLLAQNKNEIVDRNFILKAVWNEDSYYNARSMDVYIAKLRKALKNDATVEIINIHGKGFMLSTK